MSEKSEIVGWGQRALEQESLALTQAATKLSENFADAVLRIFATKGKVVLTGLGKSGHIARKIAATFASTGTSSFFMHPSEALHGDSGMLDGNDILLAIGFNGETREVVEVAKFARRIGVCVISITGNLHSALASLSDIVLDGGVATEACPLNLAPTSSTTVALALGDALAVALMRKRGFQEVDFARYHPEGSLGRKLSLVRQHMIDIERMSLLRTNSSFQDTLHKVTQNNLGISAVVSDAKAVEGVVTDGDLRRAILQHQGAIFGLCAHDFMTREPKLIVPHALAVDALQVMEAKKITALLVVDDLKQRTLLGLVRMHDLLAAKII